MVKKPQGGNYVTMENCAGYQCGYNHNLDGGGPGCLRINLEGSLYSRKIHVECTNGCDFFGGRVNLNHLVQMVGTLLSLLLLFAVSIKIWFSMLEKLLLDELGGLLSPPQNRIGGFIT